MGLLHPDSQNFSQHFPKSFQISSFPKRFLYSLQFFSKVQKLGQPIRYAYTDNMINLSRKILENFFISVRSV